MKNLFDDRTLVDEANDAHFAGTVGADKRIGFIDLADKVDQSFLNSLETGGGGTSVSSACPTFSFFCHRIAIQDRGLGAGAAGDRDQDRGKRAGRVSYGVHPH